MKMTRENHTEFLNRHKRWYDKFEALVMTVVDEPESYIEPKEGSGVYLIINHRRNKILRLWQKVWEDQTRLYLAKDENGNYLNTLPMEKL